MYVVAQPKPSQRRCSSHVRSEQLGVEASPGQGREKGQEEIPEEKGISQKKPTKELKLRRKRPKGRTLRKRKYFLRRDR